MPQRPAPTGLAFSDAAQRFKGAREAYQGGRAADGIRLLDAVLQSEPKSAPALYLMGLCLIDLGRFERACGALHASLTSDKSRPDVHVAFAQALERLGRLGEAEKAYRAGLALDRRHPGAVAGLSNLLLSFGRTKQALQITTPLVAGANAPARVLELHADGLRRLGHLVESLDFSRRAVAEGSPQSELGMTAVFRELGRYQDAEASARRAVEGVGEHPAAMAALGRTLQDLGRHEEAGAVYRQALTRAPLDPTLHQALASLVWARTGDPDLAATPLDSVLRQRTTTPLLAVRAKLHTRAGRPAEGFGLLSEALQRAPDDLLLLAACADAAVQAGELQAALSHAERAAALAPTSEAVRALLAEVYLAAGRPDQAAGIVETLLQAHPYGQQYLALQAVTWRLAGDPRHRQLYDYGAMVQTFTIPTPPGWPNLTAYLTDLATVLKSRHGLHGDPLGQSMRKGVQTQQNLALSDDPVLQAFFSAIDLPIVEYLARVGDGADPLRSRKGAGHRIKSAWSVKLEADGFHADHLHPEGWLSSAFYVELPKAIDVGHEGWIKFGQPGAPTTPALGPEHFERPQAGRLVLFPSYMWHGTIPFGGDDTRLSMAFDVTPGKSGRDSKR
jgi:tetratricopeptide (TPR) repeat protein